MNGIFPKSQNSKNQKPPPQSQRLPKIIGIKVARKLLIHVHHMHIPFPIIPHHRARPLPILFIALNLNTQAPIHLETQQHLIINGIPPAALLGAVDALELQLLQPGGQVGRLLGQALGLHLGVGGGLCDAELVRVEAGNGGRVVGGRVGGEELVVLGVDGVELAREALEG